MIECSSISSGTRLVSQAADIIFQSSPPTPPSRTVQRYLHLLHSDYDTVDDDRLPEPASALLGQALAVPNVGWKVRHVNIITQVQRP